MGGGYWEDNMDGTFTNFADDFFVPASGPSSLDLYMMGLLAPTDVPEFFVINNLAFQSGNVFTGTRQNVTINEVIANANVGARVPNSSAAQTDFRTGFVGIVLNDLRQSLPRHSRYQYQTQ